MGKTLNAAIAAIAAAACAAALAGCTAAHADLSSIQPDEPAFSNVPDRPEPEGPAAAGVPDGQADGADRAVPDGARADEPETCHPEPDAGYDGDLNNNPAYLDYGRYAGNDYGNPFESRGVTTDGEHGFGWYSQNAPGFEGGGLTALNENGRHVDETTGFIMDGDGYIAVAMDGVAKLSVVPTPWGDAKVYDSVTNSDEYTGYVDIYTDF